MQIAKNITYGWVEALSITDRPTPSIKDSQVLVRVMYSSVNRTDLGFLKAKPSVTRLFTGLFRPRYISLGCEFSGVVDRVGKNVDNFKVGDRVFGYDDINFGGHAEYKAADTNKMIATVPDGVSLQTAAIATEGSHYALAFMNKVTLKDTCTVFVHGATGGIGSAMVQLLVARGIKVVASSPTESVEIVKSLGATEVIDWQTTPLQSIAGQYDHFFDAVGKSSLGAVRHLIKPGGSYVSSELGRGGQNIWFSLLNPLLGPITKRNVRFPIPSSNYKRLTDEIRQHLATEAYVPLLDREYSLHDIKQAYEYVETGQKKGNVRIKLGS